MINYKEKIKIYIDDKIFLNRKRISEKNIINKNLIFMYETYLKTSQSCKSIVNFTLTKKKIY